MIDCQYPPQRQRRRKVMGERRCSTRTVVTAAASLAAFPMMVLASDAHNIHAQLLNRRRRRGRRKNTSYTKHYCNMINHCRGGDIDMPSDNAMTATILNAYDKTKHRCDIPSEVISASSKESTLERRSQSDVPQHQQPESQLLSSFRPRLVIEFDTQAVGAGAGQEIGIRDRIRSRIGKDDNDEWHRLPHRGSALSIYLDTFSPPPMPPQNINKNYNMATTQYIPKEVYSNTNNIQTLLRSIYIPTKVAIILVAQTAALLPPLILSRRALNSTWIAIVDYFRGRVFRTTFTNLERAYLRYYEFPAAIRAMARLVSQIGILLGLSWAVRWWMILVLMDSGWGPSMGGVTGVDIGMIGTASGGKGGIGPGWEVGLPCHQRGHGMAWLCGLIWIGAVVGIGHAAAVALAVWGGPLRLQAVAQQAENPKHVLRRIIYHPIIWIRGLEEWKHFSALSSLLQRNSQGKKERNGGEHVFNPDPLLFPATWLPLRWLQIFAVAKAFSTDPLQYRWCSPEDSNIVIPRLMKQYLVQLALGDEWHRVFLGEKRMGLGTLVVVSYFISLLLMVFTTFTLDGGAAAMLIPSVFAAIISGMMNIMIFWNWVPKSNFLK